MSNDSLSDRTAAITQHLKMIRRLQSEMLALTQKMQTSAALFNPEPEDWEDRYVREGFLEIEGYANGDPA